MPCASHRLCHKNSMKFVGSQHWYQMWFRKSQNWQPWFSVWSKVEKSPGSFILKIKSQFFKIFHYTFHWTLHNTVKNPMPRCTCLPPRQHCVEVALGGKQVHLGCASVYLLSSSCNFNSSTPRPSSSPTRLRLVGLELGLGVLERSQWWAPRATSAQVPLVKSKFNSASPRWTWTWLGELERSRPSSPPPAVELIP